MAAAGGGGGALSRLAARLSWALFKRERCGVDEFGNIFIRSGPTGRAWYGSSAASPPAAWHTAAGLGRPARAAGSVVPALTLSHSPVSIRCRKLEKNADGEEIERRFVKYSGDIDPTQLPAEWHQWLHKARGAPPTAEDIQRGMHQRELFRQRVAQLEAEDERRRFQEQTGGASRGAGGFVQQLTGDDPKPPQ